ncbi:MAG TPA: ATP synthase subunit C [Candidatus Sulfotelmatobacter sp.]|nr:ATP synthase subunit C [Candidatus Sulfotelmatobacter sp.]
MMPRTKLALGMTAVAACLSLAATALLVWVGPALAQAPPPRGIGGDAAGWGLVAAALATGLSSLGAGVAVGRLGTAAVGALAEKPELLGRLLIFVGLAEGIAIYGVIISILILNRLS